MRNKHVRLHDHDANHSQQPRSPPSKRTSNGTAMARQAARTRLLRASLVVWVVLVAVGLVGSQRLGVLALPFPPPYWHCVVLSFSFVASLYVWDLAGFPALPRDHPTAIRRRTLSVVAASAGSCAYAWAVADMDAAMLGLRAPRLVEATLASLGVTMVLFLGPLLQLALPAVPFPQRCAPGPGEGGRWGDGAAGDSWAMVFRNVVVAPVAEEFVFRSLCSGLFLAHTKHHASPPTPYVAMVFSSVLFGLAHTHHILETGSVAHVAIMFAYTTAFALFNAFVFLATGHLLAAVACHAFCNTMGLPDFGALLSHPHKGVLRVAFVVGVAGFAGYLACGVLDHARFQSPFFPQ